MKHILAPPLLEAQCFEFNDVLKIHNEIAFSGTWCIFLCGTPFTKNVELTFQLDVSSCLYAVSNTDTWTYIHTYVYIKIPWFRASPTTAVEVVKYMQAWSTGKHDLTNQLTVSVPVTNACQYITWSDFYARLHEGKFTWHMGRCVDLTSHVVHITQRVAKFLFCSKKAWIFFVGSL